MLSCFALLLFGQLLVTEARFSVVAYLPEWRYGGLDYENAMKTVTHLIFFRYTKL
jgi:hypothetical protein